MKLWYERKNYAIWFLTVSLLLAYSDYIQAYSSSYSGNISNSIYHEDTLSVIDGYDHYSQRLLSDTGMTYIVQAIDENDWSVPSGYYTAFQLSDLSFPSWVTITSVVISCHHYENGAFQDGALEWKVGYGWPDNPAVWAVNSSIPIRKNKKDKATDTWDVTSFVNTTDRVNQLEFVVQNNEPTLKTAYVDYIVVIVEWEESIQELPSVSITSPSDGDHFIAGDNITILADAADNNGSIIKVEFFEGGNKLGEDTTTPFSTTWNNVEAGGYYLTSRAMDNDSATTVSDTVHIAVGDVPHGNDLIVIEGYDEKSMTYLTETSSVYMVQARDEDAWIIDGGYYTSFQLSDISFPERVEINSVSITCEHYEEGAYPDGDLEWQVGTGWPGNPILWASNASIPVHKAKKNKATDSWDVTSIVDTPEKVNLLEFVIQNNETATLKNIYVDYIRVSVDWIEKEPVPPVVEIISPDDSTTFMEEDTITIQADATDSDGSIIKVEFYQGEIKIGEDTTDSFGMTWMNVSTGEYRLTAVAFDDQNCTDTSSVVNVMVIDQTEPASIDDLIMENIGNGLLLNWTEINRDINGSPETIDHYEVYRATIPTFPSESTDLLASIADTFHTDNTPGITGDPAVNYYYHLKVIDDVNNVSDMSNVVGEFDFSLSGGWTFISYNLDQGYVQAKELGQSISGCTSIYTYNPSSGWILKALKIGTFWLNYGNVTAGYPYLVYTTSGTWTNIGELCEDPVFNLESGWNLITLPLIYGHENSITTGMDLGQSIPNCTSVYRYDSSTGWVLLALKIGVMWLNYGTVSPGQPYLVYITAQGVWP